MGRTRFVAPFLVLLVLAAGCASPAATGSREFSVSEPGSTLSVKVTAEGAVTITATIPPGCEGAGTYVSTNAALQEDATDAKNALNEPGGVTILVDGAGTIVGFGRSRAR